MMEQEYIDILKIGIKNLSFTFVAICMFVTLWAAIMLGVLIKLLLYTVGLWLLSEVVYFLLVRVIRFVVKKINR